MKRFFKITLFSALCFFSFSGWALAEEKWDRVETILHIHSRYSYRGKLTPEQIVDLAMETGRIGAVIFTDEALAKISYGFVSIEKSSVFKKGLHWYLKEMERLNRKYPDLLVLSAVEVAPFYYWEKSPFSRQGVVRDWSKHLLVMGLDEAGYRSLPLVGNRSLPRGVTIYSSQNKILPYQRLIDDVRKKGGLVFWAHPEAKTIPHQFGPAQCPVTFMTDSYPEALVQTKNYTGYGIFFEGFKTIGPPGGIWDQLLAAFCRGERKDPIWAIGEIDFTEQGRSGTWVDTVKTVIFPEKRTKEGLLEALREGRMVAVRKTQEGEMVFRDFWVEDTKTKKRARLGETLVLEGSPRIHFLVSFRGSVPSVQARLIRNGEVVREWKGKLPVGKSYEDPSFPGMHSYYRLELRSEGGELLATNPIFVSRKTHR